MSNYSSYSVFLDYDVVRGLCWSMAVTSIPCNIFVIIRFILLNCRYSRILLTKTFFSLHQFRFSISHNPSIFLLFNLTLGDLIASLYLMTLAIGDIAYTSYYRHVYGSHSNYSMIRNDWVTSPTCTMARIFSQLALLISILMTFIVAVDRFILVVFPRSRRKITMKSAHIITTVLWLLVLMIAIPVGLLSSQGAATQSSTRFNILGQLCNIDSSTSIFVLAVAYLELFLGFGLHITSMILYIIIYRKLKKSKQNLPTISSNRAEKRVSIILAAVVLTNVFTYLPVTLFSILGQVIPGYDLDDAQLFPSIVMLLYVNAVVNPILFIALSDKIGLPSRQIGQGSDCNTSKARLNVTQ